MTLRDIDREDVPAGVAVGILLSMPLWVAIGFVAYLLLR